MSYNAQIDEKKIELSFKEKEKELFSLKVHEESTLDPTRKPRKKRRRDALPCKIGVSEVYRRRIMGWRVSNLNGVGWRYWDIICTPSKVIFPTREGESISKDVFFPEKKEDRKIKDIYTLTYPGTASTKCIVVFTGKKHGFVVGAEPSLKWAELSIRPITKKKDSKKKIEITIFQRETDLYILPFKNGAKKQVIAHTGQRTGGRAIKYVPRRNWRQAVRGFPLIAKKLNPDLPRFMLQMGIRNPDGKAYIKNFSDPRLLEAIDKFHKELGPGNIIHLFGTNKSGFDNGFPDFLIDRRLGGKGGKKGLRRLVNKIHERGLYASHHFNPRIASVKWLNKKENRIYKKAVLRDPKGNPWEEKYKKRRYRVMNPSHDEWQKYCVERVRYFEDIGFDYVELDQISYQRNVANPNDDIGTGFQDMINLADKGNGRVWIEGVSDIYKLPPGAWFQMLPRTRHENWLNKNENRRGYIGKPESIFYRSLMPDTPISVQIVMDTPKLKDKIKGIRPRLVEARKMDAVVLDLELGFFNEEYFQKENKKTLLNQTLIAIKNFAKSKGYKNSIDWLNLWFIKQQRN
jgi:hypothetical protein